MQRPLQHLSGEILVCNVTEHFYSIFSGDILVNTFSGEILVDTFSREILVNTFSREILVNTFSRGILMCNVTEQAHGHPRKCEIQDGLNTISKEFYWRQVCQLEGVCLVDFRGG